MTFLAECVNSGSSHSCFFEDESIKVYKSLNTSDFAAGKLILKPLKEKGHQFVHMDTIVSTLVPYFNCLYVNRKSQNHRMT